MTLKFDVILDVVEI